MQKIKPGNMSVKRSKLYIELSAHIKSFCESKSLTQEFSKELSDDIVDLIAVSFGGQNITFPADAQYYTDLRSIDIYNDFVDSFSYSELASKYGLTERGVRKVIERVKEKLKKDRKHNQI
ncbi:TPA: hypothetical protein KEU09_003331 [Serratia marcescens]|nr:hypothetical protein [Serratia marcescens]